LQQMIKLRPLGHVHDRLVPALQAAREAELDGTPAVECVLGPRTGAEGLAGARVGEVDGARALAGRRPLLAVGRPVRGPVHTPARRCLGYRAAR
jgi:hypothetical protein